MKKLTIHYLWGIMLIMTACSGGGPRDFDFDIPITPHVPEVPKVDESAPLRFTTYTDQTQQSVAIAEAVRASGFGLYVAYHDYRPPNKGLAAPDMYNVKASWDASVSQYGCTPAVYWPKETEILMTFYGYAPYVAVSSEYLRISTQGATSSASLRYISAPHAGEQVDLLTFASQNHTRMGAVSIEFKHVLSQVSFAAKLTDGVPENTSIRVKALSFYYAYSGLTNRTAVGFSSDGVRWTLENSRFPETPEGEGEVLNNGVVELPESGELVSLCAPDKYLMFIPQIHKEGDVYCLLDYDVVQDVDGNETVTSYSGYKLPLPVPEDSRWYGGKHYVYTIMMSADNVPTMEVGEYAWHINN